ncbi:hypothetical protein Pelo_9885 [Pelomyxa schiedti]|nr:hypothetical protein Pelo_9885 [Pelomyxa schiedti]
MATGGRVQRTTPVAAVSAAITSTVAIATCGSQFGALMASSLRRCGARSPARHVAADAPLMRSWWRRFVLEPSRPFVLVMGRGYQEGDDDRVRDADWDSGEEEQTCVTLSFGVSAVTLGVTREPRAVPSCEGSIGDYKWVAADLCMHLRGYTHGVNAKWLVILKYLRGVGGQRLTVKSVRGARCGSSSGGGSAYSGPFTLMPADRVHEHVVMNPANADEALIMFSGPSGVSFVLVDVAQTCDSHKLVVLYSTRCSIPLSGVTLPVAITRKRNGEVVFIVVVEIPTPPYSLVFWIEGSTGQYVGITSECTNVSQLYCELWDCNNPGNPLRNVDYAALDTRQCLQVVFGSGFLFALSGNKMTVMEAASGVVVLTVEAPFNIEWIDTDSSLL